MNSDNDLYIRWRTMLAAFVAFAAANLFAVTAPLAAVAVTAVAAVVFAAAVLASLSAVWDDAA